MQNISFQIVPVRSSNAPPTRWQKIRTLLMDWSSYVRIASLLLLFGVTYLLVLRPVKKQLIQALNSGWTSKTARLASGSGKDASIALPGGDGLSETAQGGDQLEEPQLARPERHSEPGSNRNRCRPRASSKAGCGKALALMSPAPGPSHSGIRKAAILLVLLGEEVASLIFRNLNDT